MFSISFLLDHMPFGGVQFLIDLAQKFIDDLRQTSNMVEQITLPFVIFPLDNYLSYDDTVIYVPRDRTRFSITPLHLAAASGKEDVVTILLNTSDLNNEDQDITALSLALYCGHLRLARMLLDYGAHPDCSLQISSLHAAARRGFRQEIIQFVRDFGVDPDIEDKDGATPIVYALQLPEREAWETIYLLMYVGASKDYLVGDDSWTYAHLARSMGKYWLATKLEEVSEDHPGYNHIGF